jgi:DNA-binding HxlR family transcriptional regulator
MRPGTTATPPQQGSDWLDAQPVVDLLNGKWTLPVLDALHRGPCRHRDLARALAPDITNKMLSHTLRRLERDQVITRADNTDHPTYTLAPLGHALHRVVANLSGWSRTHLPPPGADPPD